MDMTTINEDKKAIKINENRCRTRFAMVKTFNVNSRFSR